LLSNDFAGSTDRQMNDHESLKSWSTGPERGLIERRSSAARRHIAASIHDVNIARPAMFANELPSAS
jgi:hypothetical protein